MKRVRMAVIGVGHLGKEHARILAGLPEVELVGVVDVNPAQAGLVAQRCRTQALEDYRPLLDQVDGVVIATPTTQHHAIAGEFLRRQVPVLVEKPLATTLEQAEELVDLAWRNEVILQVGHIERFNPAFEELAGRRLQPKYIRSERLGPFSGRSTDVGVVMDLMIHDLDLLLALVRSSVASVQALGLSLFGKSEDMAQARLEFENGCVAEVTASRVHPAPVRRMQVWAPEGFVSLDMAKRTLSLVQPSEAFRAHGGGLDQLDVAGMALFKNELFGRHLQSLSLARTEGDQLTRELQHFVHCIQTRTFPRVSGQDGKDAIALAARILEKIHTHCWNGNAAGPRGPHHLPVPLGPLFLPAEMEPKAA